MISQISKVRFALLVAISAFARASLPESDPFVPRGSGSMSPTFVKSDKTDSDPYPQWGNGHLVWLSSDQSNQENVTNYVKDYEAHKITVSAVNIDSLWSTGVDNFIVDTTKFPDFAGMSKAFHASGKRITVWATSMVDTDSSNYDAILKNGTYLRDALGGVDPLHWWHGDGLLADLTIPEGRAWFGSQMENILPYVDGFKADGTDPFMLEYVVPLNSENKSISYDDYRLAYYGSFFNITRENNPEGLIMSRPVDSYYLISHDVSVYLDFSCRTCCFAGWVGDQDPTFDGMLDALTNVLWSGWAGYVSFGTDTGGYRTGPGKLGRTAELLLRWAGMNAFLPFFENGGDKEHRPWIFDEGTGKTFVTDSYRALVAAHLELQPYLLSEGAKALASNFSIVQPRASQVPYIEVGPGKLALDSINDTTYQLGDNFYVVPVYTANQTTVNVTMPKTDSWSDYWQPNRTFAPGQNAVVPAPLGQIPVFVRHGSIVPLHVSTPYLHHGDATSAGKLTVLLERPDCSSGSKTVHTYTISEYGASDATITYTCTSDALTVTITDLARNAIVLARGLGRGAPSAVEINGNGLIEQRKPSLFRSPLDAGRDATDMDDHVRPLDWPYSPAANAELVQREANLANQRDVDTASSPVSSLPPHWTYAPASSSASHVDEVRVHIQKIQSKHEIIIKF